MAKKRARPSALVALAQVDPEAAKARILAAYAQHNGDQDEVAKSFGVDPMTVSRAVSRLGIGEQVKVARMQARAAAL